MRESGRKIEELYQHIYWKKGATLEKTGEKTLTLRQFEKKYSEELIRMAYTFKNCNLWRLYTQLPPEDQQDQEIIDSYRALDLNVNVNWPLQHYRTSVVYLARRPNDIAATGGTNWQKYLPPRFQKRIFYPELWSEKEVSEWGKAWVQSVLDEAGPT